MIKIYKIFKYWISVNKMLGGIFITTFMLSLGYLFFYDYLPQEYIRYFEFVYNLCLAYITGFIFYFLTNGLKEIKIYHLYYFRLAKLYSAYLSIIANSFYKKIFYEDKFYEDRYETIKIQIPLETYKEFFSKNKLLELSEYEIDFIKKKYQKKLKRYEEYCKKNEESPMISSVDKINIQEAFKENYKNYKSSEIEKFIENYQKIEKTRKELEVLYSLLDSYELEKVMYNIEWIKEWNPLRNKENNEIIKKYKYFYKNLPFIYERIERHLNEILKFFKCSEYFMPVIQLEYAIPNTKNFVANLYLKFYKNTSLKQYYTYFKNDIEKNILIKEIKLLNGNYMLITENDEKINFEEITSIIISNLGVELINNNRKL